MGGEMDREDVETIEEIGSEAPLPGFLRQVTIGRSDDADIDREGTGATNALELSFLQDTQELGLEIQRQLPNLIQEERAPIGQLETAQLAHHSASKGTFFVPKQLTFDQARRDGGTVELYQWLAVSSRARMARKGDRAFLTRPCTNLGGERQALRALRQLVDEGKLVHLGYGASAKADIAVMSMTPSPSE